MLKYKVKLNEPKGYNEIKCDELYLSPDMSFISGVTDYGYELLDGQHLSLEFNNDNIFHDVVVEIKNVTRQGYVILNQQFKVEEYKGYKGFYYIDGKYYFTDNNTIKVKGRDWTIDENNNVNVDTTYWVEDGILTIGDNKYDTFIYLNKDGDPINNNSVIIKGGKQLVINNCEKKHWKKVTKFIIRKDENYNLKLDDISCAKKYPYFFYNIEKDTPCNDKTKIYEYVNKKFYLKYNQTNKRYENHDINGKIFYQDYSLVKCDSSDEKYKLEYEWRNTESGNLIHIFLSMPQYYFTSGQKIIAESSTAIVTKCDIKFSGTTKNNDGYIVYCGKKYYESKDTIDFLVIDNIEYKLQYINKDYAYITINDNVYYIQINDDEGIKLTQVSTEIISGGTKYPIIKYHYVTIENEKFLVKKYTKIDVTNTTETNIEYVEVIRKEKFTFGIVDVVNNSMLRCSPDVGNDGDAESVCSLISASYKSFRFSLLNPIFEEHNIIKDSFILAKEKTDEDVFDVIKIYNPSYYIKIPLTVGNDMSTNVLQEDILENIFFKNEKEKSINPYVDMEREIYYPCYNSETDNEKPILSIINEIQFDLHFRSRNLEDWKINDDVFTYMDETAKKQLKIKHTWNIFDNYYDYYSWNTNSKSEDDNILVPEINSTILNSNEFKYYQPADLLHFLNFTTDDVFYQKSKISKSFLRLLFFDNNDVANQTLLYSCTVFMNENKLYKTYIDNVVKNDNLYVSINEELNDVEVLTSSTISVYNDTCIEKDGEYYVTFEEDKRLAAKFIVKNRYEAEESAEGFYLHIFKDYSEKLHDKTIYMKVEFNHAGEGRTINFTMPFRYNDEGNPILLDLSPEGDGITGYIENGKKHYFKEGYPLKELYEHMFIPIKVVYDDVNKRYSYYLPKGLAENSDKEKVMKFNLYELKIKDESEDENNN